MSNAKQKKGDGNSKKYKYKCYAVVYEVMLCSHDKLPNAMKCLKNANYESGGYCGIKRNELNNDAKRI